MISVLTERTPVAASVMRRQVNVAQQPATMAAYLQEALGVPGVAGARHAPACRILDMKYEPGEYCTILYELGERMVIGSFHWGQAEDEPPPTARLIEALGMQVYRFEDDPALPGLTTALDPRAMATMLAETLPECQADEARILRCKATPLRYR